LNDAIIAWLSAIDGSIERLGLEAGPLSPWLYEGLRAAGVPAIWIETRRMKGATAVMAVKTDRNGARAIAQAMRVSWFTAVHVKTAESQELRLLLTNRKSLVPEGQLAGHSRPRSIPPIIHSYFSFSS
jgi:transposase